MKKAETYEEAKIIIKNSTREEITQHNKRVFKLRTGLITLLGIAGAISAGIMTEDPSVTTGLLPIFGLISLNSIKTYLLYLRNLRKVDDETFYKDKSEEEVIRMANEYVDEYNNFMSQMNGKGNSK